MPEHPLKNAAVAIVVPLHRGVEPHDRREYGFLAGLVAHGHRDAAAGSEPNGDAGDGAKC
jgi:hypothetical protein